MIVATGGDVPEGICDAAARFETANVSSTVEPTWINMTNGDSLFSVAVTGPAVYVGGHQRWLDNGAVSRPGIGAIDPVTGMALAWNPTKSRNHGTVVLYATPEGLWVGSDGERFGGEDHAGIGFAPLDLTPDTTDPTVVVSTPPAGAVYARNRVVNADYSCADTGSSGLASCEGTVADGHAIDTATLGAHTFTVTASDHSGNTTEVNRTYTVANGRPDARIRRGAGPLVGNNLYNTTGVDPDPKRRRGPGPDHHLFRVGPERRPLRRAAPDQGPGLDDPVHGPVPQRGQCQHHLAGGRRHLPDPGSGRRGHPPHPSRGHDPPHRARQRLR